MQYSIKYVKYDTDFSELNIEFYWLQAVICWETNPNPWSLKVSPAIAEDCLYKFEALHYTGEISTYMSSISISAIQQSKVCLCQRGTIMIQCNVDWVADLTNSTRTWNITSPAGKEPELVAEQFWQKLTQSELWNRRAYFHISNYQSPEGFLTSIKWHPKQ